MYLVEKLYNDLVTDPDNKEGRKLIEEYSTTHADEPELIRRTGKDKNGSQCYRITEAACDDPDGSKVVYRFNDTFIELRTPFDDWRGLITLGAVGGLLPAGGIGVPMLVTDVIPTLVAGADLRTGEPLEFIDCLSLTVVLVVVVGWLWAMFHFGWRIFRLESFTQRRLLVRFNRRTRKVYVHRPSYAGGIVELDWECVTNSVSPRYGRTPGLVLGVPMALMWYPLETPHGRPEMVFVGRCAQSGDELERLWEFIRRYMEEGPQSVPRPRCIGKFPWPWRSVMASGSLAWPLFKMGGLRWLLPLVVLVSPAIACTATGHWISQLLCWEPVFPRRIRQACGEGIGAVIKARLIDAGAWLMAAAVGWGLYRFISSLLAQA
ncbi:hypothetical protein IS481_12510 [Caldimonas thermodepolymerans]|jgi:hypothetical protein|uniref:DUF6708 domain-containing protein n=1 Tax=Caldimonas thermodepolymerans TaxID=215580 RepID=A0A2S5T9M0_9BURK|nr:DUF6708 domain-containing protein [Caldimonas thermodepolymerans]PPE71557.1 hypothetical protein C1702_00735 [Caldimonas thermodepolymerans]QPC30583.1 hypothetical protein IS481_12510 [Caldimonas thermodepolymerans]RDI02818.1 hypothetical protein DES46_102245 [Caldimonas thermodepolymerans]TCP08652.1 hypothetical protein EV676_102160 [Caldimonas thermodepolymerans]UZG46978.1 hypothetical protein ONS87_13635 [Caldimonas thermodepolymerans]